MISWFLNSQLTFMCGWAVVLAVYFKNQTKFEQTWAIDKLTNCNIKNMKSQIIQLTQDYITSVIVKVLYYKKGLFNIEFH